MMPRWKPSGSACCGVYHGYEIAKIFVPALFAASTLRMVAPVGNSWRHGTTPSAFHNSTSHWPETKAMWPWPTMSQRWSAEAWLVLTCHPGRGCRPQSDCSDAPHKWKTASSIPDVAVGRGDAARGVGSGVKGKMSEPNLSQNGYDA